LHLLNCLRAAAAQGHAIATSEGAAMLQLLHFVHAAAADRSPPHERAHSSSRLMHSPTSPSITTPFNMWMMGYGAYKFQLLLLLPPLPLGTGLGLGLGLGLMLLLLPPLANMLFVTGTKPSTAMHAAMTRMNMSASVTCRRYEHAATNAAAELMSIVLLHLGKAPRRMAKNLSAPSSSCYRSSHSINAIVSSCYQSSRAFVCTKMPT
jgi:hypothetical protein